MTSALRWVTMRDKLIFHNYEGQSHKTVSRSQDTVHRLQLLKRKESRSGFEPRSLCLPAYNALPLGQTGSRRQSHTFLELYTERQIKPLRNVDTHRIKRDSRSINTDLEANRHRIRQAENQTETETDRQTDRQTKPPRNTD